MADQGLLAALQEKLEALGKLRGVLDDSVLDTKKADLEKQILVLTGGGDYYNEVKVDHGDFVQHDKIQVIASDAAAREFLAQLRPKVSPEVLQQATVSYFNYLLDRYQYFALKGMGLADRTPLQLPLLDLYVPLRARLETPKGETWDRVLKVAGREDESRRLSDPQPILDLLQKQAGLVVLGDPGAGKTTFLKFLTLQLACGQGEALGIGRRFPVLVPLSGYAEALSESQVRLDDYIAEHYHNLGADLPLRELLAEALQAGRALVLLDGLDEVKETRLRQMVVQQVEEFYCLHWRAGNKFVVTSRIVGYREAPLEAPGLRECTLDDFDAEQIREFVERWTAALERQAQGGDTRKAREEAERERQELLEAIDRNEGVRQLASNPLLLTILALMKRQGVTLPERRVELYDQYVKTLLSSWNRARGLGRPPTRDLDVAQTLRILAPLALWMHEANPGAGLVKREDLRRRLEAVYRERDEADPAGAARQFLSDVREHAGLLLERGAGEYGFIHLTFEEYLAGMAIAMLGPGDVRPIGAYLGARVGQTAWREPSLLAVGYLSLIQQREPAAGEVVELLAREKPGEPGAAVVLAGAAVLDGGQAGVPSSSRKAVIEVLVRTMQDARVAGQLRREAGLLLGKLGWAPEDLETFVFVPAGKFLCGDEREERDILHDYWISRYPVTNLQYARFVADEGYEQQEWWSDVGWKWRAEGGRTQPRYWDDEKWNNPIFPVVGVTQYEAEAYCAWLTAQLNEGKIHVECGADSGCRLVAGPGDGVLKWQVRLPTDEEWERAARGTDGREYPWGDEFDSARANTTELGDIGTNAVCTYPQGVSSAGAWEMAGNVWEWVAAEGVARGGSWFDGLRIARCAYRNWGFIDLFFYSIGLRVILSLVSADSGF